MKTIKNSICGFLLLLLVLQASAQTSTEDRTVGSFSYVDVGGAFKVIVTKGNKEAVKVIADQEYIGQIVTETRGDILKIFTKGSIRNPKKMEVYITYKTLKGLEVSGATAVKADNEVNADEFKLALSGAGSVDFVLNARKLKADVSGAGSVNLKGKVSLQDIDMSGAGSYRAYELVSEDVKIDMSGAGTAQIYASKSIDADISGVGSVYYKGKPGSKIADVSGLGKFKSAE
jgi:hypothetical protein